MDDTTSQDLPGPEPGHAPAAPDADLVLRWLPDPVIVVDGDGRIVWANRRAELTLGYRLADVRGTSGLDYIHPDDLVTALASLGTVQGKELGSAIDVRFRAADGRWIRFESRGWSGIDEPLVGGVVLVLRRLDDRDGWTVTGGDARRRAAVLANVPAVTLLFDSHGRLEGANRAYTATTGRPLDRTLGRYLPDLVALDDRDRVRSELEALIVDGGTRAFEAALSAADDADPVPFWLTAVNLLDDVDVRAVVISGAEIAPLIAARHELAHRITHDALTGAANRDLLLDRLAVALRDSAGTTGRVGVVVGVVDDLAEVGRVHGHGVADAVLVAATRAIEDLVGPDDLVARLGEDRLAVLAVRDSVADVEALMAAIVAAVADPDRDPPVAVTLTAGSAVARYGARADDVLHRAERAVHHRRLRPSDGP